MVDIVPEHRPSTVEDVFGAGFGLASVRTNKHGQISTPSRNEYDTFRTIYREAIMSTQTSGIIQKAGAINTDISSAIGQTAATQRMVDQIRLASSAWQGPSALITC
jgi:hypothetical protein